MCFSHHAYEGKMYSFIFFPGVGFHSTTEFYFLFFLAWPVTTGTEFLSTINCENSNKGRPVCVVSLVRSCLGIINTVRTDSPLAGAGVFSGTAPATGVSTAPAFPDAGAAFALLLALISSAKSSSSSAPAIEKVDICSIVYQVYQVFTKRQRGGVGVIRSGSFCREAARQTHAAFRPSKEGGLRAGGWDTPPAPLHNVRIPIMRVGVPARRRWGS